jgi:D-arabinose 1-dehydrogenase-like Zn-dependent alcohol dehydrogenase
MRDRNIRGSVSRASPAQPSLCAGLIDWRSLVIAGEGKKLGLYGFGAAAHIVAQVAKWQGRSVFAFTRPGDAAAPGLRPVSSERV